MRKLTIYLPRPGTAPWKLILKGSGIVGAQAPVDDALTVDYEGNRYGAANLELYADRVVHAADRHVNLYPTVARMIVAPSEVEAIGEYDVDARTLAINVMAFGKLSEWLDQPERMERQLIRSGT